MARIIIAGAGGHGKVVADIALLNGYDDIAFLDDADIKSVLGFPVIGTLSDINNYKNDDIFIAIGDPDLREKLMTENADCNFPVLVHPKAVVSKFSTIEKGSVVMAGAVINADTKISQGCIVNTCASIDHDCVVGNFCHIAVGAHIAGGCRIDEKTWVGLGANINNNISVTKNCIIASGATVVKDINEAGVYIGTPAKRTK